jgi:hypothetical protein
MDRPDHLKPSAYELPRIHPSYDPLIDKEDDDTDDDLTLADLQKNSSTSTSQDDMTLPGGGLLPSNPKGLRVTA